ncbi:MAG: IscS subfamily cysteine desulfurase [Myxococcota bacterium]
MTAEVAPELLAMSLKLPIYLDNHATTAVDPRVMAVMIPYFTEHYGNAASRQHAFGWRAEEAVEIARQHVATAIGATGPEIVFTSGATEANNLALFGVAKAYAHKGKHIVTQCTEHKAVLDPCRLLEQRGFEVTYVPVDKFVKVDLVRLSEAITKNTILVSIMHANNEIGTVQPLGEIGRLCSERDVLFHSDVAQSLGKISVDVQGMGLHLVSMSAHKTYGPKGVGALYVRRKSPRVNLKPMIQGGGHERGLRAGTLNVAGIVGFGEACRLALDDMPAESQRLIGLRDGLWERIRGEVEHVRLNGPEKGRHPGNLNVSFGGIDGEMLLMRLRDICVSSGAACASATQEPSHVLRAIGVSDDMIHSSIRLGIGRFNTSEEIEHAATVLTRTVTELRHR